MLQFLCIEHGFLLRAIWYLKQFSKHIATNSKIKHRGSSARRVQKARSLHAPDILHPLSLTGAPDLDPAPCSLLHPTSCAHMHHSLFHPNDTSVIGTHKYGRAAGCNGREGEPIILQNKIAVAFDRKVGTIAAVGSPLTPEMRSSLNDVFAVAFSS